MRRDISEPFFTKHESGHITAYRADELKRAWVAAHEIVQRYVNTHNRMVDLDRWKAEALPLLDLLDRCHDLLPLDARAPLGHSKADAVEAFLRVRRVS